MGDKEMEIYKLVKVKSKGLTSVGPANMTPISSFQSQNLESTSSQLQCSKSLSSKLQKQANKVPETKILAVTTVRCPVCEESIAQGRLVIMQGCRHGIHKECLLPSLELQLKDGRADVKCPFEKCSTSNLSQRFLRSVLEDKNMKKYYRLYISLFIQQKQRKNIWQPCPQPDCKQLFKKTNKQQLSQSQWYRCNTSQQLFCIKCNRKYHPKLPDCQEYENSLDPNSQQYKILTYMEQNGYKQCPNCRRHVEKNEGCNHITCRCKYEFCYACEGPYPNCNCITMRRRP